MRLDDVGIENLRKFVNCGYGSPPAISALLHLSKKCAAEDVIKGKSS